MSDLEDLRIINEMTYIVWLHSVYFIMGSVQESLSNHVQHPVYSIVGTMFKNHCPIMYNILFIALWVQCSRIIVQSCTTSCLLHCGYNVQESLSNHVQHPVYCNVDTQSLPRVVGPYTLSSLCQES